MEETTQALTPDNTRQMVSEQEARLRQLKETTAAQLREQIEPLVTLGKAMLDGTALDIPSPQALRHQRQRLLGDAAELSETLRKLGKSDQARDSLVNAEIALEGFNGNESIGNKSLGGSEVEALFDFCEELGSVTAPEHQLAAIAKKFRDKIIDKSLDEEGLEVIQKINAEFDRQLKERPITPSQSAARAEIQSVIADIKSKISRESGKAAA